MDGHGSLLMLGNLWGSSCPMPPGHRPPSSLAKGVSSAAAPVQEPAQPFLGPEQPWAAATCAWEPAPGADSPCPPMLLSAPPLIRIGNWGIDGDGAKLGVGPWGDHLTWCRWLQLLLPLAACEVKPVATRGCCWLSFQGTEAPASPCTKSVHGAGADTGAWFIPSLLSAQALASLPLPPGPEQQEHPQPRCEDGER